ncbi:MAG: hypothetical protein ACRDQZ_22955, partial [Mycobacteriales bacterium]
DHDCAVAAHCAALDLEHLGRQRPLTQEERRRRDTSWAEATRRWAALDEMPQIWGRLRDRVAEIDDPRLTVNTVDDIRDNLPIRLVTIHAELALLLGQRDVGDAERQRKLIDQLVAAARPDTARVDAALRAVVAPVLRRIETTCEAARSASARDPADGCATGARALEQLRPAVRTVSAVLTPTHPTARAARDQLADTLNLCAVRQANATKITYNGAQIGFTAVLDLLKEAEKFACLAATTKLISENTGDIRQLHAQALQHGQGAAPRSTSPTTGPAPGPRTGSEIFAELRRSKRGPWSYIDRLCQEGYPNLAHDALALWGYFLARDPVVTKQINTLLAKPAPFVARMKRPPKRAMVLGCGVGIRSYRGEGTVGGGNVMAIQYLVLFFIPLIPIAAYLVSGDPPRTFDFVGKVPLGMGPRYWRKLLTAVSVITLAVLMFGGGGVALFWVMVLRIGIQVCKTTALRLNIRRSMAR